MDDDTALPPEPPIQYSVSYFGRFPARLLAMVKAGHSVTLTDGGVPVARLMPLPRDPAWPQAIVPSVED